MADDKMTESRPVEPMKVTIIGTGDGTRLPSGTEAATPGANQPNLIIKVVQPILAIAIRFANTFLTTLVGLVVAGMTSNIIPAHDFLSLVAACAKLSVASAGLGFLKDCITVFGRLEQKFPLATGRV